MNFITTLKYLRIVLYIILAIVSIAWLIGTVGISLWLRDGAVMPERKFNRNV